MTPVEILERLEIQSEKLEGFPTIKVFKNRHRLHVLKSGNAYRYQIYQLTGKGHEITRKRTIEIIKENI